MELSPWTVYLILQLDQINCTITGLLLWGTVTMGLYTLVTFIIFGVSESAIDGRPQLKTTWKYAWAPLLALCLFNALLPSSKNMAAVVIVPAIVNNETVQNEARELYDLAKQALKEAVTDESEPVAQPRNHD